jgi:putative transposase
MRNHQHSFSVARMSRLFEVSSSGYYAWLSRSVSARERSDNELAARIREIDKEHDGRYGTPRVVEQLRKEGHFVSRKRVGRIRRQNGLKCRIRRRFRRTTDSRATKRIAPNLLERDFTASEPNRVWVGDVTYVPTREGWLYLAVLIDLYSRRIVSFGMSSILDTHLVLSTLKRAVSDRKPSPGLIHHTDRDSRYAADSYLAAMKAARIVPSMSRKGDCWDNAVAESFFATLEKELLSKTPLMSRRHAMHAISAYIDNYYNLKRLHSAIDYLPPIVYELMRK